MTDIWYLIAIYTIGDIHDVVMEAYHYYLHKIQREIVSRNTKGTKWIFNQHQTMADFANIAFKCWIEIFILLFFESNRYWRFL